MFLLPKLLYTQAGRHIHTVQRHTDIKSGGSFLLLHPALPLPPSLSRRSILLLISWLHICLLVLFFFAVFFFIINKALIAFSLEFDLVHCLLSF